MKYFSEANLWILDTNVRTQVDGGSPSKEKGEGSNLLLPKKYMHYFRSPLGKTPKVHLFIIVKFL